MFTRVNSEDVTDDIRALYLLGLQKVLVACKLWMCECVNYVLTDALLWYVEN